MGKPAGYLKIKLEKFLRLNAKKARKRWFYFFFQNIFLGKKIKDFSLARNIERKYFREIQLHQKKFLSVKSMCENEKMKKTRLNYLNGFYYLITVVQ